MNRNKSRLFTYINQVPSLNISDEILIRHDLRQPENNDRYSSMIEGTNLPTRTRLRRRNAINPLSPINRNNQQEITDNELTDIEINDDSPNDVVMTDIENQSDRVETIYFEQSNIPPPPIQEMSQTSQQPPPPIRPPPPPPPLQLPIQPRRTEDNQIINRTTNANTNLPDLRMPVVRNNVNMNFNIRNTRRLNIRPRERRPNLMFMSSNTTTPTTTTPTTTTPNTLTNSINSDIDTNISNIIRNINTSTSNIIRQVNLSQLRRNTYQNHNLFNTNNDN